MKRLLIAGCGDLGVRLAGRLNPTAWAVTGLRRQAEKLRPPIQALAADLNDPASLGKLARDWDAVIYQATPGERSPPAYRRAYVEGLQILLERVNPGRLIFVSSTAVFGQDDGSWVDESSPTEPSAFNGEILLEAEGIARSAGGLVVRYSGIYGPGRDFLLRQIASGRASCQEQPVQWTNRIHADDCAGVLAHLLELDRPEPLYCASDCRPSPRCEVLDWLAARLGQAQVRREAGTAGQGKRIDNRRLRASGYDFIHPDYQSGYGALLA